MLVADLTGNEVQKFRLLVDNKSAIELSKNQVHQTGVNTLILALITSESALRKAWLILITWGLKIS
jgi:hypothetical protein